MKKHHRAGRDGLHGHLEPPPAYGAGGNRQGDEERRAGSGGAVLDRAQEVASGWHRLRT